MSTILILAALALGIVLGFMLGVAAPRLVKRTRTKRDDALLEKVDGQIEEALKADMPLGDLLSVKHLLR